MDALARLAELPAINLALIAILFILVGGGGVALRRLKHEADPIDGVRIVNILEADKSPLPRHWDEYIDNRVVHKLNNITAVDSLKLDKRLSLIEASINEIRLTLEHKLERRTRPRG